MTQNKNLNYSGSESGPGIGAAQRKKMNHEDLKDREEKTAGFSFLEVFGVFAV
jgi:hypothetical protein